MSDFVDIEKAAILMCRTQRHVRRMCIEGELPGAVRTGGRWKIPATAHPRLVRNKPAKILPHTELLGIPADKREEAIRRLGVVKDFERFAIAFTGYDIKDCKTTQKRQRDKALDVYASNNGLSKRTLYRWIRQFHSHGIIGLVDMRGGGKFVSQMISPEAFDLFKSMYLTQQQLSVKTCWQNICFINRNENKDWKIPSLRIMYKYVKAQIPLFAQVLHREGLAAFEAKCAPYIQTAPDSVAPGQIWVGDHSQFNCWIRYRGKWIRPWVTAWMDMRSRCIVGWHISASPNQTTILLAAKRAIEKYGPPDSVKVDNGRDYDSEMWTGTTKARRRALRKGYLDEQIVAGIYAMMDIGVSFAIPYHPQSKPIERWFDTMDQQFTKTISTYCGKDINRRPDYLKQLLESKKALREAYDMAGFTEIAGRYIEAYNNSAHNGYGMNGQSPAEMLASRSSRRVLQEGVLDLVARGWSRELVVGKNGVRFKGIWYGQYGLELLCHQGKKVRVAYDPDDLRKVYVYDATTLKLITIADQNQLIRYGDCVSEDDLRWAMRQKSKAVRAAKAYHDSRLTANMDLTSLTIRAMQEARKQPNQEQAQTLRPVRTPMDNQSCEHERQEVLKAVKKAAGAESVEKVLDLDFNILKPANKYKGVKLFDE